MVPVPRTYFRSRASVYRKDKYGVLHAFENLVARRILVGLVSGKDAVSVEKFVCDLQKMKVLVPSCKTAREEEDLLIEFPWDAKSFSAIVAQSEDDSLRRQVLLMALDRIRSRPILIKILALKDLPTCDVLENAYIGPGHAPYENFFESLVAKTKASVPGDQMLYDQFIECAADGDLKESFNAIERKGIQTVFHGTNHEVMDAILYSGLDPRLRRRDLVKDYFGIDYNTSLEYTKSKTKSFSGIQYKLLVFMVIDAQHGANQYGQSHLTIESNKFQLPIAEVTLGLGV